MRRLPAVITIAATVVGALAACSNTSAGPNPNGPVDTAFAGTANIACEAALGVAAPTPFPSGVNPTDPPPTALPAIGSYLDGQPLNHKGVELLHRLGQPKQGRTSWQHFITSVNDEQQAVGQQIAAAKSSDPSGYLASVRRIATIAGRIDATGTAAGLGADSYCLQLFG